MKLLFPQTLLLLSGLTMLSVCGRAADIQLIGPDQQPAIEGKEIDWIYGDYLLRNESISLVIAAPLKTRDANLTIRGIGGSILDLSLNHPSNDQLSAYIPTAGRYLFQDPSKVEMGHDRNSVYWRCRSSSTRPDDGTTATIQYRLADGNPYVEATVSIEGEGATKVAAYDGIRADGWFTFESSQRVAFCSDAFFRQTIGFKVPGSDSSPDWKKGRPAQLRYTTQQVQQTDDRLQWTVQIYPATSPVDLLSVTAADDRQPAMYKFKVIRQKTPAEGYESVNRAEITLNNVAASMKSALQTDDQGIAYARLSPGEYTVQASAIGYTSSEVTLNAGTTAATVTVELADESGFRAVVTDGDEKPIPVKATIYAIQGDHPEFGPTATRTFVQNCVYSVHGKFQCPLDPGKYEIYFSRGPEYHSQRHEIEVASGQMQLLSVKLDRVVDTSGWVSADLHSHSSPSGDNTSDQYGRVENLLCENLEFAPCTEHNRISSYTPHLQQMGLVHLMATCTGMELTGSPLPVNHQNSFPLHHHRHTQNGGGPRTSSNPVVQIERLAMWDQASDKIVQMNHPNLHQIHGDVDLDGKPDAGFRGMLAFTDVIEVHPLTTIFEDVASDPPDVRKMRIPLFQWMQMLNHGYRIPGVINTDAHYNHHGSGGRRIWIKSSSDDPAKISTDEMIEQLEAGHVVMSTGPFLSVSGASSDSDRLAIPGDDLVSKSGKVKLDIKVQCPNWLDVNRVQVFINGRPSSAHNYTRKSAPDRFGSFDATVKFASTIEVALDSDAHLIVAAIGEQLNMQKVMGPRSGDRPPIAVSNPIFVDLKNDGFTHNHDDLGLPLPGAEHLHGGE